MAEIATQLGGQGSAWVDGYRVKILAGLWLAATDHRLQVLRAEAAAALPGKSLVVLEPQLRLATDIFPCIVVQLNQPTTCAGDSEIVILTAVPASVASALEVAQLYRLTPPK
jgi:hypothetical protein